MFNRLETSMTAPLKYPGLEVYPGERNDPDLAQLSTEEQLEHQQWTSIADWVNDIGEENGCQTTCWSMYEIHDFGAVAHEGEWTVKYDGGWGIAGEEKVTNPTYLQLWQIADRLIRLSGDLHHIFVEDFSIEDNNVLDLSTGS